MAHMMKHKKASCGHMFAHFDRKAEHISNENLDRTRSHLNYNLATHQQMDQGEFVRKRCSEVRCQNRKDANVMVTWVITAPKDLPEAEHENFFQASYDFCKKRYGKENVVSSYVHMDEITPHMHFAFIPIVKDKKRGGYKLSAKECVNRSDLQTFHKDLEDFLSKKLGHEVGILNEATKEGNKSIEELKRQSAAKRLQEATEKASKIVYKAQTQAQVINDTLIPVKAEYEAKKALVDDLDCCLYPPEAKKSKKGIFKKQEFVTVPKELWEQRSVSTNAVVQAMDKLDSRIKEFRQSSTGSVIISLAEQLKTLENKNLQLRDEIDKLQEKLRIADKTERQTLNKLNSVLQELPPETARSFVAEWRQQEQPIQSHSMGIGR